MLQLHNKEYGGSITCVGWAKSQGRRCRNPSWAAKRSEANATLRAIAREDPNYRNLESTLEELAENLSCKRWHHCDDYSIEMVLTNWKMLMKREFIRLEAIARAERSTPRLIPAPAPAATVSEAYGLPSRRSSGINNPSSRNVVRTTQIQETRASTQLRAARPSTVQPRPTPFQSGQPTSQTPSFDFGVLPSLPNQSNEETQASNPESNAPDNEPIDSQPISSEPSVETISDTPCSVQHVQRRPLDEECSICTDPLREESLQELIWCKSTCGNNMHRSCFECWRPVAETNPEGLNCPFWYVNNHPILTS